MAILLWRTRRSHLQIRCLGIDLCLSRTGLFMHLEICFLAISRTVPDWLALWAWLQWFLWVGFGFLAVFAFEGCWWCWAWWRCFFLGFWKWLESKISRVEQVQKPGKRTGLKFGSCLWCPTSYDLFCLVFHSEIWVLATWVSFVKEEELKEWRIFCIGT